MLYYYGIDWTYIILVLPAVLFSLWASGRVNRVFRKYSDVYSRSGVTGFDAARRVLDANGLYDVRIERVAGNLTDHFDPKARVIRLSDGVYSSSSVAAIGVASHEAGHAIQHAVGYKPIRLRTAIVPITNFGSKLSIPLILVGLLLSSFGQAFAVLAYLGVACFSLCVIFQLVTLPTEFDASRRALRAITDTGLLADDEVTGSRKVLSAAAMTYVAALAVAFAQLLRLLALVNRSNNRR